MRDYIDGALYWLRVRADWAVSGEEWTVGRYGSTAYDGGPGWSELLGRENGVPLAWADLIEIGPLIGKKPGLVIRPNPVRGFAAFMEACGVPVDREMVEAWAAYCEEPVTPHGADPEANEHA